MKIARTFTDEADVTLHLGDCLDLLGQLPERSVRLIVTSPPYNLGKPYETRRPLFNYIREQRQVIDACVRLLPDGGSLCWQVGNYLNGPNEVVPLDLALFSVFRRSGLTLRNRIVWHFDHGLHAQRRLSGRHEVILWYTKGDDYVFDLDAIRVRQKYPGKRHFKGPNNGRYSGNPRGKNPGDVWLIPNVKHNHVEKTIHPCQFPVELVERLVLGLTKPGDLVVDPYVGVGTTAIAAIKNGRRAAGADINAEYLRIATERLRQLEHGTLRTRPMDRAIYEPPPNSPLLTREEDLPNAHQSK